MAKATAYVVDKNNVVHFRWCAQGQPYVGHNDTTAAEMLAHVAKPDLKDKRTAPSMLAACAECVVAE